MLIGRNDCVVLKHLCSCNVIVCLVSRAERNYTFALDDCYDDGGCHSSNTLTDVLCERVRM